MEGEDSSPVSGSKSAKHMWPVRLNGHQHAGRTALLTSARPHDMLWARQLWARAGAC